MPNTHTVQLRNGEFAEVVRATMAAGYRVQGFTRNGAPQLWHACGHWSEDHCKHPLDIVAVVFEGGTVDITSAQENGK